jgi:hypothetical protein
LGLLNRPEYIIHWAFASDEREAPSASNNLQIGGKFKITMAAKDKSASFNYYCHNDTSEEDISFFVFISGASMNSARSLAPALISGVVSGLRLYWTVSLLGPH